MRLQFSSLALQDLDAIFSHINNTLHNPTAARNTIAAIIHTSVRLSDFPRLGAIIKLVNSSNTEVRYIISGSYLIAYVVKPTHIEIVRILYARSDYIKLLDA